MQQDTAVPMPPIELRRSVGHEGTEHFENPHGGLVFGSEVPAANYRSVFDFGCGCGRVARQMLFQHEIVPARFLGIDLSAASINWCRANLSRRPGWEFRHLNAYNPGLNPGGVARPNLRLDGESFTLINAHSVFTHIIEDDLEFYFGKSVAALASDGILRTTWFLFDKVNMPMMQTFQNSLYINVSDPTNAVIYDVAFVRDLFARHGLTITQAQPPAIRGHQWLLYARRGDGRHVDFAPDMAPTGLARPPASISG